MTTLELRELRKRVIKYAAENLRASKRRKWQHSRDKASGRAQAAKTMLAWLPK